LLGTKFNERMSVPSNGDMGDWSVLLTKPLSLMTLAPPLSAPAVDENFQFEWQRDPPNSAADSSAATANLKVGATQIPNIKNTDPPLQLGVQFEERYLQMVTEVLLENAASDSEGELEGQRYADPERQEHRPAAPTRRRPFEERSLQMVTEILPENAASDSVRALHGTAVGCPPEWKAMNPEG
jgi:hypothetical protein